MTERERALLRDHVARLRLKVLSTPKCPSCGNDVPKPKTGRSIYCSKLCRNRASRRRVANSVTCHGA